METSGQCSCIHAYVATSVRNFSAALPGYANPPILYDKGNRIINLYILLMQIGMQTLKLPCSHSFAQGTLHASADSPGWWAAMASMSDVWR